MPAKSLAQRGFMGLVKKYKEGKSVNASDEVKKAAMGMTMADVEDFTGTPTAGLPMRTSKRPILKRTRRGLPKVKYI